MAFGDIIQSPGDISYTGGVQITLDQTPISGNLLVACIADLGGSLVIADDFTQAILVEDNDDLGIFYKISDGTEDDIVFGGFGPEAGCVIEIEGPFDETELDDTGSAGSQTDTSAECGTATGSTTNAIAVAAVCLANGNDIVTGWNLSFDQQSVENGFGFNSTAATLLLSATGDVSPIATLSTSADHMGAVAIFKAQAAILIGTVCFGHDTGVVEDNVIDFANQGEGTATPSGSGDSEILTIDDSEYWEFRDINFGTGECTLDTSKYQSPTGLPVVKYKTAVTQIGLSSESWTVYTVPFTSSGWVKVRVEN